MRGSCSPLTAAAAGSGYESAAAAFVLIKSVKAISIQNTRKNHRAVSAQSANLIVFQIDINWKLCKVDTIL